MKVFDSVSDWLAYRPSLPASVGMVPTMGALHAGHASLLQRSVMDNEITVLTIYLNPTQFNDPSDLEAYPKTRQQDLAMANSLGVDYVITPSYGEVYEDDFRYQVVETNYANELCGAHREGHFTGVLTVVMKLLNIVRPARAYFGEKDYQQYQLIRDMCKAFFMPVQIVPCTTVREADGLAMSSRNQLLDAHGRAKAGQLHRLIRCAKPDRVVRQNLRDAGFEVDYLVTHGDRRFAAVTIHCSDPNQTVRCTSREPKVDNFAQGTGVRLIDNVRLKA